MKYSHYLARRSTVVLPSDARYSGRLANNLVDSFFDHSKGAISNLQVQNAHRTEWPSAVRSFIAVKVKYQYFPNPWRIDI